MLYEIMRYIRNFFPLKQTALMLRNFYFHRSLLMIAICIF